MITGKKEQFRIKLLLLRLSLMLASVILFIYCTACNKAPDVTPTLFDSIPASKVLIPLISEISGIAESVKDPQSIYGIEDSGNPTVLYQIRKDGHLIRKIFVKGVVNRDWEDMALSGGSVYVGDIGDNSQTHSSYSIYRFLEPAAGIDSISQVEKLTFTYPDGSHDAEAFVVDDQTIYIITKRDVKSRIYQVKGLFTGATVEAVLIGELPYSGVVSAAMNVQRSELIIKTYTSLFYYPVKGNEPIEAALKREYVTLPYTMEPQGEAVCFSGDGSGYYTLSEKGFSNTVKLYYYKRK